MKRNKIKNIIGWMPASLLLLLAAACSENVLETASVEEQKTSEVTFTVNMESSTVSTRASEEEASDKSIKISKGQLADVLVYAVYEVTEDENGEESLKLDTGFGKEKTIGTVTAGTGQRLLAVTPDNFPVKISLSIDVSKKYKMAFWLQNSEIEAYDATDLQAVKVKYTDESGKSFANNDERRDAFCALSDVIDPLSLNNTVTLHRPLAQVNVGTTGWDYEGAAILKPSSVSYTKSQITLKGVAQYYDVVNGKALSTEDLQGRGHSEAATTDVTFDYARIPAFINVSDEAFSDSLTYSPFWNEEFLKVELDGEEGLSPYIGWNDYYYTHNRDKTIKDTETFKYLSMSYVLVPESKVFTEDDKVDNATNGAVLDEVVFSTQGIDENSSAETAGVGQVFSISNVPVQKNWRTNILGTNFFFLDQPLTLTVVTDYNGEYNYNAADKEEDEKTPDEEADEVHEIWFDNYRCGSTNQNALEPTDFFKMLQHNYTKPTGDSYHKHDISTSSDVNSASSYTSKIAGRGVGRVLKVQGKTGIAFTVEKPSTVTIVQAIGRNSESMPAADGTLLFYKQLSNETLTTTPINGITQLTADNNLVNSNDSYIQDYFDQKDYSSHPFIRLDVDNPTETEDYSATTTVYTTDFYDGQANTNTNIHENIRIYEIYVKNAGTYILRNGGQYKPGTQLKKEYMKNEKTAKADESGIAYIKVQQGDRRKEKDWWQKNEYPKNSAPADGE